MGLNNFLDIFNSPKGTYAPFAILLFLLLLLLLLLLLFMYVFFAPKLFLINQIKDSWSQDAWI
jgi:hypothetical protein